MVKTEWIHCPVCGNKTFVVMMKFILGREALNFWKSVSKYVQIGEQRTMKMKPPIHRFQIREIIIVNNILHTLMCIEMK